MTLNDVLEKLFDGYRFINFSRYIDHAHDEEEYTMHAVDHDGNRVLVVRESAEDMVRALLGREQKKECRSCGAEKPLHQFSRAKDRKDGRAGRCRACEAGRVKRYLHARKSRQASGHAGDNQA